MMVRGASAHRRRTTIRGAMATTTRLTATEFLECEGNERHVQLIDGEVVVNRPIMRHQTLVGVLHGELRAWTVAEPGRRGKVSLEVDTRLDERNVYKPDDTVMVARRSRPTAAGFDLALELGRGDTLASPQLPGFALDLTALFDEA
jgi:hypothetical protein